MTSYQVIPRPASGGSIPQVQSQDWAAINNRVAITCGLGSSSWANIFGLLLPNFGALASACQQWESSTYPGILAAASLTGNFSARLTQALDKLSQDLSALPPNDPLPKTTSFIDRVELGTLAQMASTLATQAAAQQGAISNFAAQNLQMDQTILGVYHALSGSFGVVGPHLKPLEDALAHLLFNWDSIVADLVALSNDKVEMPPLVSLLRDDVAGAIAQWTALSQAVGLFLSTATPVGPSPNIPSAAQILAQFVAQIPPDQLQLLQNLQNWPRSLIP